MKPSIDMFLGKSLEYEENGEVICRKTLVDHTVDVILNLPIVNEESVISALWHDVGKINPPMQKRLYLKNNGSNGNDKFDKYAEYNKTILPEFFNPIEKIDGLGGLFDRSDRRMPRHEIISCLYLFVLKKNGYGVSQKIINNIAWHHFNNLQLFTGFGHSPNISALSDVNDKVMQNKTYEDIFFNKLSKFVWENRYLFLDFVCQVIEKISSYDNCKKCQNILSILRKEFEQLKRIFSNDKFENISFENLSFEQKPNLLKLVGSSKSSRDEAVIDEDIARAFISSGSLKRGDHFGSGFSLNYIDRYTTRSDIVRLISNKLDGIRKKSGREKLWQEEILEKISLDKKIYILEAPTGSGKTLFAELLFEKLKPMNFILYTIPYTSAINEKFEYIYNKNSEIVGLIHGTANIEAYKVYLDQKNYELQKQGGLSDVYKELSMMYMFPYILSTADQTLIAALEYFGSDIYFPLYSKAFVVIDEPQAYTSKQMAIIWKTIEIITAVGGKVLIMSATLPHWIKKKLEEIQDATCWIKINDSKTILVDSTPIELSCTRVKNTHNRHKVELIEIKTNKRRKYIEKTVKKFEEILGKWNYGGARRILIIRNTVEDAYITYDLLRRSKIDEIKGYSIKFLHSRMLWKDKSEILRSIGEEREIVITTQMVEAAVDYDADLLFTDISPIDSLVQRMGRCYRNRGDKEYLDEKPNVFVFYPKLGSSKKKSNEILYYWKYIYPSIETYILVTVEHFKGLSSKILSQEDESKLVELLTQKVQENIFEEFNTALESLLFITYSTMEGRYHDAHNIFRSEDGSSDNVGLIVVGKSDEERIEEMCKKHRKYDNKMSIEDKVFLMENSINISTYLYRNYFSKFEKKTTLLGRDVLVLDDTLYAKLKEYGAVKHIFEEEKFREEGADII